MCGREVSHLCLHTSSAFHPQLFPEQPNFQEWWELATGTCTKPPPRVVPAGPCSVVRQSSPARCRKILFQPKLGVKFSFLSVSADLPEPRGVIPLLSQDNFGSQVYFPPIAFNP